MYRVWIWLAAALAGFYALVVGLGFRADVQVARTNTAALAATRTHIAAAFFLVVSVLFVHSLCMFYMIGSGRSIREAITEKTWSPPYLRRIRAQRMRAFPWAMAAMVFGIATVWVGAAVHTGVASSMTHRIVALAGFTVNLLASLFEWNQLRANSLMIAELNARLHAESRPEPVQEAPSAGA